MRQGPLKVGDKFLCTGCEFSNKKNVAGVIIEGATYYGPVWHCIYPEADQELRVNDETPMWCPLKA